MSRTSRESSAGDSHRQFMGPQPPLPPPPHKSLQTSNQHRELGGLVLQTCTALYYAPCRSITCAVRAVSDAWRPCKRQAAQEPRGPQRPCLRHSLGALGCQLPHLQNRENCLLSPPPGLRTLLLGAPAAGTGGQSVDIGKAPQTAPGTAARGDKYPRATL